MKKFLVLGFAFIFAISPFFAVNFAFAASTYVDDDVSFSQGLTKGGAAVNVLRSDPSDALGIEDGEFVSLGYDGEIVLAFPNHIGGGALSITPFERTNGEYPIEKADVYVSSDNSSWTYIGSASNEEGAPSSDPIPTVIEFRDMCIKYVKLVDTTNGALHTDDSDGYDLDAVMGTYEEACTPVEPEEPCDEECQAGNDYILNDNSAFVKNRVSANANTGGNVAGGSYGGEGGDAGSIHSGDVDETTTGNGGQGGNSGIGGTVLTGNATSVVDVTNEVNNSRTVVDRCACFTDECCGDGGNAMLFNRNRAIVMNYAEANTNTGANIAEGSYAGEGGNGGKVGSHHDGDSEVDESTTGNGGVGGNSSDGGLVQSGDSRSVVNLVNVINRTITRIMR